MRESIEHKITCLFCGKERIIKTVQDDGMDYMGHARGPVQSYDVDNGCECPLGKIEHEKAQIKKMCHNCLYFKNGNCTCKEMLDEVSGMFQMPSGLQVKHPDRCCGYWKINLDIFRGMIKED